MDTIERIRRIYERHEPAPIGKYRFFSVLIPFVEKDGELCLLYEVRARDMDSDPGEICFPGGHVNRERNCLRRRSERRRKKSESLPTGLKSWGRGTSSTDTRTILSTHLSALFNTGIF